jgi:hypothetical protein
MTSTEYETVTIQPFRGCRIALEAFAEQNSPDFCRAQGKSEVTG